MRRTLATAVLSAALVAVTGLTAVPAAAETRNFTATRGDSGSPTTDIVAYSVTVSPTRTSVAYAFAAPNTDQLASIVSVDTTGDGDSDFEIYDSGSVYGPTFDEVCTADVRRNGTSVSFSLLTSCLSNPSSLRVQLYASTGSDSDFVPSADTWSPAVRNSTATAPTTPPPAAAAPQLKIALSPPAITRGQTSRVWVAGVPGEKVLLYAFTSPSTTYRLVRTGTTNAAGLVSWPVRPGNYTRLYAAPDKGPGTRNSVSTVLAVQPPPAPPRAVYPVHGGEYTAVYLTLSTNINDPALGWSASAARRIGYVTGLSSLGCDLGAPAALRQDSEVLASVLYFPNRTAAEQFVALYGAPVSGVVAVKTLCLD